MNKVFIILLVLLACAHPKESEEDRIKRLGDQLRCPVCRGVPISESPSPLAVEMRNNLCDQVSQGKSDTEIFEYFEERYGEWILLNPKAKGINLGVWILPLVFMAGGAVFIILRVKRKKDNS